MSKLAPQAILNFQTVISPVLDVQSFSNFQDMLNMIKSIEWHLLSTARARESRGQNLRCVLENCQKVPETGIIDLF